MKKRTLYIRLIKRYRLFSLVFLFALACTSLRAQNTSAKAYQVKAAFLYNFSQFVEWPEGVFATPDAPFVIGLSGANPFGSYLNQLVAGEKINGHPIVVRQITNISQVKDCHILFINGSNISEVLAATRQHSILTVSDAENFAARGGMIRFFIDNNKIRFQINPSVARAANLNISSKLLRLAEIVE